MATPSAPPLENLLIAEKNRHWANMMNRYRKHHPTTPGKRTTPLTSSTSHGKRNNPNTPRLDLENFLRTVGPKRSLVHDSHRNGSCPHAIMELRRLLTKGNVFEIKFNSASLNVYNLARGTMMLTTTNGPKNISVLKKNVTPTSINNMSKPIYFLIIMYQKTNKVGHAIAAVKQGDKLFVFNPWGTEIRHETRIAATAIAKHFNVSTRNIIYYKGRNLQARNRDGVCVGFSKKFLIETNKRSTNWNPTTFNRNVESVLTNNTRTLARQLERLEVPISSHKLKKQLYMYT
jgi:hypothetical protein